MKSFVNSYDLERTTFMFMLRDDVTDDQKQYLEGEGFDCVGDVCVITILENHDDIDYINGLIATVVPYLDLNAKIETNRDWNVCEVFECSLNELESHLELLPKFEITESHIPT